MNNSFKALLSAGMAAVGLTPQAKAQINHRNTTLGAPIRIKGLPYRHHSKTTTLGPFVRQVGIKHLKNAEGEYVCTKAIMQTYYIASVMHYRKGLRNKVYVIGRKLGQDVACL